MIKKQVSIQTEGSMPDTHADFYLIDKSESFYKNTHPFIIVCPGGGYTHTSMREGDPMAFRFLSMGFHVAVLRYSCAPAEYPTALCELAAVMKLIHENAEEWGVEEDHIVVQGCSAGGHLAASLGVFWQEKWLAERMNMENEMLRPAGMLLCYPVITSGQYAHEGSFISLLGKQYSEEMLEKMSLEKQVTKDTPPAFLWHTFTDEAVPVQNSLLFIEALKQYEIPTEFHMYPVGRHGLSVCDIQGADPTGHGIEEACQSWVPLAKRWLQELCDVNRITV